MSDAQSDMSDSQNETSDSQNEISDTVNEISNRKVFNIPQLGHKGCLPPRKQKFPRKKIKLDAKAKAFKVFVEMNDHNRTLAEEILSEYEESDDANYKESILLFWIGVRRMPERAARKLFQIGHHRYARIVGGLTKQKPGGKKPNWVSEKKILHMKSFFDSLTYTVGFPCPHRNQKNYIEMEGILTWAHVYNLYLNFLVENLSVPAGEQITRISDSDYKKGKLDSATVSMHSDSENENESEKVQGPVDDDKYNDEDSDNFPDEDDCDDTNDADDDEGDNKQLLSRENRESVDIASKYRRDILTKMRKILSPNDMQHWLTFKMTSFSTFYKYKRLCHPDITLQKLKEDMCDTCIKYKVMLDDEKTSDSDRAKIEEALQMHLNHAKQQRRYIKDVLKAEAERVLPECYREAGIEEFSACLDRWVCNHENDTPSNELFISNRHKHILSSNERIVEVESHDYGGSLILPWFGLRKPSTAYYTSNLNIYPFIISQITRFGAQHKLLLYDERASGKDADSLCSLRFQHYINMYIQDRDLKKLHLRPKFLFVILDNCVGQNKSQYVLMLFAALTILGFYERIILHFLESGHSHGCPDIGFAHAKSHLNEEVYIPQQMKDLMNTVEGIQAEVVDFNDFESDEYPFRVGWGPLFAKYFTRIPALQGGYTKCHSFEFFPDGSVTMKEYADSDESKTYTHQYVPMVSVNSTKANLLRDLFGDDSSSLETIQFKSLQLPKEPITAVKSSKIESIRNVLFAVPMHFRDYYPKCEGSNNNEINENQQLTSSSSKTKLKPNTGKRIVRTFNPKAKKSKESPTESSATKSILHYLVNTKSSSTPTPTSSSEKSAIHLKDTQTVVRNITSLMTPPGINTKEIRSYGFSPTITPSSGISPQMIEPTSGSSQVIQFPGFSPQLTQPLDISPLVAECSGISPQIIERLDITPQVAESIGISPQVVQPCSIAAQVTQLSVNDLQLEKWNWLLEHNTNGKLNDIDADAVMRLPMWEESNATTLAAKKVIFPLISSFMYHMRNHSIVEDKVVPKLYPHNNLYLEKQWNNGCWAHCLFAILGNKLHCKFRENSWLVAALISFVSMNKGDSDVLEPVLVCERPENEEGEFNFLTIAEDVMRNVNVHEDVIALSSPKFTEQLAPSPGALTKFLQILNSDVINIGLVKVHAHLLFTSLNNPMLERDSSNEMDIYIGGKHLGVKELSDPDLLIAEFHKRQCNVMIVSIRLNPESDVLHYVTVWICELSRELWFFDPIKGFFTPSPTNKFECRGYFFPACLQLLPNQKPLIFKGSSRCAFYFNVPFDKDGNIDAAISSYISRNINMRLTAIMQYYFRVDTYAYTNVVNLGNHSDSNALYQNRTLAVKKSTLRNKHTGNSIGYGVTIKHDYEIQKDGLIGHFEGNRILVLTSNEFYEVINSDEVWQFYTVELTLSSEIKRQLREEQGLDYVEGIKYTAYLDCSESAKTGTCLVSYCNSPKDAYTFYGAQVETNAYISVGNGSQAPTLLASKKIRPGTEILWNYRGMKLPKTLEEEQYSKISGIEFGNEWLYPFTRTDIIRMITDFNTNHPRYMETLLFLENAIENINNTDVVHIYRNVYLNNKNISKHRLYDVLQTELSNDAYYLDGDTIEIWFGPHGLLYNLEIYLCNVNSKRVPSMFINSLYGLHLKIRDKEWAKLKRGIPAFLPDGCSNIFECKKVFIAHNEHLHWTLYTIFIEEKFIAYYDSLNSKSPSTTFPKDFLYDWLQHESEQIGITFVKREWTFVNVTVQKQTNGIDCGFHVIKNALLLQMDLPLMEYTVNMTTFRIQCLLHLKDKYLSLHPASADLKFLVPPNFVIEESI